MAPKRKTAKERLRQEIKRVRSPTQYLLLNLLARTDPDWSDKRVRGAYANVALTLDGEPAHSSLRKAFKAFELNSRDPWNWRYLIDHLARVLFPASPRGAPTKWDEPRRRLLNLHVDGARARLKRKHGHPSPTDSLIVEYLQREWPEFYGKIAAKSLRRYIVSARRKGDNAK